MKELVAEKNELLAKISKLEVFISIFSISTNFPEKSQRKSFLIVPNL